MANRVDLASSGGLDTSVAIRRTTTGRGNPVSPYAYGLATYDAADSLCHADRQGFVRLQRLGSETWSQVQGLGRS